MEDERKVMRELEVKMAGDEIQVMGRDLGRKYQVRAKLDEKRKRYAQHFKSKISKVDEDIATMSEALEKGAAVRPVECLVFIDGAMERVRRLDTNEVIESRALTMQERQRDMFGGEKGEGVDTESAPDGEDLDEGDDEDDEDLDDLEDDEEVETTPEASGDADNGKVIDGDGATVGEFRQAPGGGVGFHTDGEERDPEATPETTVEYDDKPAPLATLGEQVAAKKKRAAAGKKAAPAAKAPKKTSKKRR